MRVYVGDGTCHGIKQQFIPFGTKSDWKTVPSATDIVIVSLHQRAGICIGLLAIMSLLELHILRDMMKKYIVFHVTFDITASLIKVARSIYIVKCIYKLV